MALTLEQMNSAAGVRQAILSAASATGVDFTYLYNQAKVESGLNPAAKAATSSATGLFQFIEQSWLGIVAQHGSAHGLGWAASAIERGADGRSHVADPQTRRAILDLRRDPALAATMAAELAADNRAVLERRLGRSAEPVDLYLAHFLGAAGATRFLRRHATNPDATAAEIFPAAARANRAVFFDRSGAARSLDEVRTRFAAKIGGGVKAPEWPRMQMAQAQAPAAPASQASQASQARLAYLLLASMGVSA